MKYRQAAGEEGWIERTKAVLQEGGEEGGNEVNGTPSLDTADIGGLVSPALSEQGDAKKSDEPSPLNKTSTLRKVSVNCS